MHCNSFWRVVEGWGAHCWGVCLWPCRCCWRVCPRKLGAPRVGPSQWAQQLSDLDVLLRVWLW